MFSRVKYPRGTARGPQSGQRPGQKHGLAHAVRRILRRPLLKSGFLGSPMGGVRFQPGPVFTILHPFASCRKFSFALAITSQGTVPEAIICFLESSSYEDSIRKAISLGGDSDTLACITGGIAQAYYKEVPIDIIAETEKRLLKDLYEVVIAEFFQAWKATRRSVNFLPYLFRWLKDTALKNQPNR